MAGRITAMAPQRGRRERLNVFLDGRFAMGVDQARIDEVLDEKDEGEDERAYQAGLKRLRLLARCDEDEFRKRLCAFLQRRGFDYETARGTAERLWAERDTLA